VVVAEAEVVASEVVEVVVDLVAEEEAEEVMGVLHIPQEVEDIAVVVTGVEADTPHTNLSLSTCPFLWKPYENKIYSV